MTFAYTSLHAPRYVSKDEVDSSVLEKEREILRAQVINEGKPEAIADKIVDGKISKFYQDICLLEQPFVKDPSLTVAQLVSNAVLKIGEKISVRRFSRFVMGEGLEKRQDDLAEEVEKQIKG